MDNYVEKTGKTVQEAVMSALKELDIEKEEADVEVIDEGKKGWMGLIGTKEAKVRVVRRKVEENRAKEFLMNVFEKMKMDVDINIKKEGNLLNIELKG